MEREKTSSSAKNGIFFKVLLRLTGARPPLHLSNDDHKNLKRDFQILRVPFICFYGRIHDLPMKPL